MTDKKKIARQRYLKWKAAHPGLAVARAIAWAKANPERYMASAKKSAQKRKVKISEYHKQWWVKNKHRALELKKKWKAENKEYVKKWNAEWKKKNSHKVNASTRFRQARELQATPKWANQFFMEEAYDLAARRSKLKTGGIAKWHVDHIVPLRSKHVCGLHVEHNLQVIPASMNVAKSNKHWPDMWEN